MKVAHCAVERAPGVPAERARERERELARVADLSAHAKARPHNRRPSRPLSAKVGESLDVEELAQVAGVAQSVHVSRVGASLREQLIERGIIVPAQKIEDEEENQNERKS